LAVTPVRIFSPELDMDWIHPWIEFGWIGGMTDCDPVC